MSDFPFGNLRPIRLEDRAVIAPRVAASGAMSCEYNFVNLYAWGTLCHNRWAIWDDALIIHDGTYDNILMPLGGGEWPPERLLALSRRFIDNGFSGRFSPVPADYLDRYPRTLEGFDIENDPDQAEYIYSVDKLIELRGTKLSKKKNLISQFHREQGWYMVSVPKARCLSLCLKMSQLVNRKIDGEAADEELTAMGRVFAAFDALGAEALVLRTASRIAAFSVFSRQSDDLYITHYEKAARQIKGASQIINQATAKYLHGKCRWINREQDLGVPGLRQAKSSYYPDILYRPLILTPKA